MAFYVVAYTHPDAEKWEQHLAAHVDYLLALLENGTLRASGPFVGTPVKTAMLILKAPTRDGAMTVLAQDPFMSEGLVTEYTITDWDPVFGTYHDESTYAGHQLP